MTKGERREAKANKRHGAMRMAGGSLRVVYAAAVLKRAGRK
jgi:hypothetical protein